MMFELFQTSPVYTLCVHFLLPKSHSQKQIGPMGLLCLGDAGLPALQQLKVSSVCTRHILEVDLLDQSKTDKNTTA